VEIDAMAEHEDQQQRPSFNWPPTTDELNAIQVIEMHPRASQPTRPWWQRSFGESVMAQAAVLAGSLAAIGIALMSLIAPAQPIPHASKPQTSAPLLAFAIAPTTAPLVRAVASTRIAGDTAHAAPNAEFASSADQESLDARARTEAGVRRLASREERLSRRTRVGADPVSRFAIETGRSMWKGLRQFGRSLKRDADYERWSSRSTTARRTAGAIDLGADNGPSDR
jgi:hypothetical protein